ncbi:MAG: hypothetical protein R3F34_06785 [Planctomycetota bacterium]
MARGRATASLDEPARRRLRDALRDIDERLSRVGVRPRARGPPSPAGSARGTTRLGDVVIFDARTTLRRPSWAEDGDADPWKALDYLDAVREELDLGRATIEGDPGALLDRLASKSFGPASARRRPSYVGRYEVLDEVRLRLAVVHELRALRIALARFDGEAEFTLDDPYGSTWSVRDDASGVRVVSSSPWAFEGHAAFVAR